MPSVSLRIPVDHPSFVGHFPGQPLLPGVVLLAEVLEALLGDPEIAVRLGSAPRLGAVKFLAPVGPGAGLRVVWEAAGARVRFDVLRLDTDVETPAATGHFEAGATR
ncbi:hypothetical protein [Caldimonas brevitalea]|uniref:(3R)-hydroxymyristoyl-[ACP] dehydratase n=1 Tax=Caldimonas brevitalea TaxID=413882 RepID=A0A0G3BR48_9BURK|nr:hypothetical protein [Caldimonas brevitalea]AKJ30468.1 (3R)-hydroxymyristoyl-[ACP] dehydratase [Caldimonas brevitalea]